MFDVCLYASACMHCLVRCCVFVYRVVYLFVCLVGCGMFGPTAFHLYVCLLVCLVVVLFGGSFGLFE